MTYRLCSSALFCLIACGGSSNGNIDAPTGGSADAPLAIDAPLDAPISAAQACMTSATERCQKLATCSPADLSKRFGDMTTCVQRNDLTCTEALAASATGNTPDSTLACATALVGESCADFFTKAPPLACTTQVGPGSGSAACSFPAQCETGFCALGDGDLCATCAPQPKVGDSCAIVACGQDLVCVAATQTCQAPVADGGACSRDLPCADGFTCVGAVVATGSDGQCKPEIAAAGSGCDPKHKTGADCSADAGLTCNTVTLLCVTQPLVAAGMTCGVADGIDTKCTGAATCVVPGAGSGSGSGSGAGSGSGSGSGSADTLGTCIAPAADGGDCDSDVGPTCLTPARCVPTVAGGTAGTCLLPGSQTCE